MLLFVMAALHVQAAELVVTVGWEEAGPPRQCHLHGLLGVPWCQRAPVTPHKNPVHTGSDLHAVADC